MDHTCDVATARVVFVCWPWAWRPQEWHLNLLQLLQVFTELVFQTISQDLHVIFILHVILSVLEAVCDLVLAWILHEGDHFILSDLYLWIKVYVPQPHTRMSLSHNLIGNDGKSYFQQSNKWWWWVLRKCAGISEFPSSVVVGRPPVEGDVGF